MMDMAARAYRLLGCKGASRADFRWDDELARLESICLKSTPARNDSAEPRSEQAS